MPSGVPLGNVIQNDMKNVWVDDQRKYLSDGVKYICQCSVCPPFGNTINFFLEKVTQLCETYKREEVAEAVNQIRMAL